jgi:hypothetical protein
MWDMTGIESVIDASAIDSEDTFNRLKDGKSNLLGSLLNKLFVRAQVNNQRHYEIYYINVDECISEDDVMLMFKDNPQGAADTIRSLGTKIHGDRVKEKVQVIV